MIIDASQPLGERAAHLLAPQVGIHEILRLKSSPTVRRTIIFSGSQSFKTAILIGVAAYAGGLGDVAR